MRSTPLARAVVVAVATAAVFGLVHWAGLGLPLFLLLALPVALVANFAPRLAVRWLDALVLCLRTLFWRREQGHHHAFAGVPLDITDDGRHVWVDADDLQRLLRRREPDDVLAARLAGHWQRADDGRLLLRLDGVIAWLATMPGRDDPRLQRVRRYFERDVLHPAQQRHQRAAQRR